MNFFLTRTEQKPGALLFLLHQLIKEDEQSVVFVATRHHVEYLALLLMQCGIEASPIYGQMDQTARTIALAKFKKKATCAH